MLTKVIEQAKIDRFARWMGHAERIVIVAHVAPDGDAIGSSLGLWHFLNSQDKVANVIVPNALDRKSTRLNSSHSAKSRMPSSA